MDNTVISTKDRPGTFDAIETAKPGEPIWTLQGGDPFAQATIGCWVSLARTEAYQLMDRHVEGTPEHNRGLKLLERATASEQVAWAMDAYRKGHVEVEGKRARYTDTAADIVASATEQTERAARIKAAERLHNIVGQGGELYDALVKFMPIEQMLALRHAVDMIKGVAQHVEPRRENERS